MKKEFFLRAVGDIDGDLVAAAAGAYPGRRRTRKPQISRVLGAAACVVLCAAGAAALWMGGMGKSESLEDCAPMAPGDMNGGFGMLADQDVGFTAEDADGGTRQDEEKSQSANQKPDVHDSVAETVMYPLTEITLRFCEGGVWRTERMSCDGGLPSGIEILNEYLRRAGSDAACTELRFEAAGSRDEILPGGILQHTAGVRTAFVTLSEAPEEDVLRGLVNTLCHEAAFSAHRVCLYAFGQPLSIGGACPADGFAPFEEK